MPAEDGEPPTGKWCNSVARRLALFSSLIVLLLAPGCASRQSATPSPAAPSPTASRVILPPSTPTPTITLSPTPSPVQATPAPSSTPELPGPDALRAKIEIVWPHDGASVREATRANITAYLMAVDSFEPPCDGEPIVRLWVAHNAEPARPLAVGEKRMLETGGRIFPVWDFNDVDVSAAQDPTNKLSFYVTVDGVQTYHNVWVHAQDARTILAQPDRPTELLEEPPVRVDAKIEIVWPHDDLPAEQAELANITTYLFKSGTLSAISADAAWEPVVRLHRSLNADTESLAEPPLVGRRRSVPLEDGSAMMVWDFDDVDVSAAQDRLNKIFFWISVEDVETFPNVWAHGADTPTIFPQVDILESCP